MRAIVPTLTGLVDLNNIDPATITIAAMSHGLGKLDRWAGALEVPFYVAQHSGLVVDIFRRMFPHLPVIYPRLHDGHEYLIGDVTQPTEASMATALPTFSTDLATLKADIDIAIRKRFDLPAPTLEIAEAVAIADQIAAATEWDRLMPKANGPCPIPRAPMRGLMPRPLSWPDAAAQFKSALELDLAMRGWEATA